VSDGATILDVRGLSVSLPIDGKLTPVVTDMYLSIARGEAIALVGESGCGKSITARAIIGLSPPGAEVAGSVVLNGRELLQLAPAERRKIGGRDIGFIFQEPMTSLHPTLSIGAQMTDGLRHHLGLARAAALDRARELLDRVGIPRSREILAGYAHQLSGGMRQRVVIAMAIACGPSLVIADEPTTALDVTIQAQVLDLLARMREELGLAMLYITHDLEVVADFCDRAIVMYAGDRVEEGLPQRCLTRPRHPYTRGLVAAIPRMGGASTRLAPIPGQVPPVGSWPAGCRFAPRCAIADQVCAVRPEFDEGVRCWRPLASAAS
jgi:oligopeptide/dipeptide ABC transporter ATP-binding protein